MWMGLLGSAGSLNQNVCAINKGTVQNSWYNAYLQRLHTGIYKSICGYIFMYRLIAWACPPRVKVAASKQLLWVYFTVNITALMLI